MKVVFLSNYLTHHQVPFCEAMCGLVGEDNFRFISTIPMEQERLNMGWQLGNDAAYEIKAYAGEQERVCTLIADADIVIAGAISEMWWKRAAQAKGVTFLYNERLFKRGYRQILRPGFLKHRLRYARYAAGRKVYSLCASAYLAGDYALLGEFKNRCYQWGYFPDLPEIESAADMISQKDATSLLWVGRLIDWKHPEYAIEAAKRLHQDGVPFTLHIVGDGPLREELEQSVIALGLQGQVIFDGNVPYKEVAEKMQKARILLATSDFNEGWGAVINEGMHAGCAVVASRAMGSVPFLIQNGENGFSFKNGDTQALYETVKNLLADPSLAARVGIAAHKTIATKWNAAVAAERILKLANNLAADEEDAPFDTGVCAKAPILKNGD